MTYDMDDELMGMSGFGGLDGGDGNFGIYEFCAEIKFRVLSTAAGEAEESARCVLDSLLRESSDYDPEGDLLRISFIPAMEDDYEI